MSGSRMFVRQVECSMAAGRIGSVAAQVAVAGRLAGRVVLVTNVLGFLGTPAVDALLREGARVTAHDPTFVDDAAARDRFGARFPGLHVSARPLLDGLVEDVARTHGRIDVLVSNDVFPATRAPIDACDEQLLLATLRTLTVDPFMLAGQVVRQIKAQPGGAAGCKLLFLSSAAPLRGLPNYAPYVTARGAINALALSLAKELAPLGVTSNAIAANYVESPSYFSEAVLVDPARRAKITAAIPLRRLAAPAEAAQYVIFLASRESDFITGQVLAFAGGWA
eukprot:Unigene15886_Nuclearia_a/m.47251 Unigene15886_Nuclearia_a/g.47251  ORF Unigene15886_Nuclearia_a/g.47251 Unigene15886_Nuclearia_a/m.47251 type:complete len:280 (+) Unigene15886_Nuclearia_a:89-928(+)